MSNLDNLFSQPVKPERQEIGHDVTIHAYFVRHGQSEKIDSPARALTDEGREQAWAFGAAVEASVAGAKGYSSELPRAQQTAEEIVETINTGSAQEGGFNRRVETELNDINLSPEFRVKMKEVMKEHGYNAGVQLYLDHGHEDSTAQPPKLAAADVAKRLNVYVRAAGLLKDGSEVDVINVSHGGKLEAFLQQVLVREGAEGQEPTVGFTNVTEIGGALNEAESFEIKIATDDAGTKTMSCAFRGQEFRLDQGRMQELLELVRDSAN